MHPHFPKFFNTAGPCRPEEHYMLPPEQRVLDIRGLIDSAAYFVIHAPRQSGKTTLLRNLSRKLNAEGRYVSAALSLEAATGPDRLVELPILVREFLARLEDQVAPELSPTQEDLDYALENPALAVSRFLSAWAKRCPLPLVIFFDEVDALQGEVLISLLRQLRDGFCSRPAPFPYSVALVGVRDVRDYRGQVREEGSSIGSASPFNIKSESLRLSNFDADEVRALLAQHTRRRHRNLRTDPGSALALQRARPSALHPSRAPGPRPKPERHP
jgi:hypothetical protein